MTIPARAKALEQYTLRLDLTIEHSPLDSEDQIMARQADRQGLGHPRKPAATIPAALSRQF
jgi:hypothetical protein